MQQRYGTNGAGNGNNTTATPSEGKGRARSFTSKQRRYTGSPPAQRYRGGDRHKKRRQFAQPR